MLEKHLSLPEYMTVLLLLLLRVLSGLRSGLNWPRLRGRWLLVATGHYSARALVAPLRLRHTFTFISTTHSYKDI